MIQEVKDADTLVIGVSTYNFGIPTSLKAWVDLVCRAGHTFMTTMLGFIGITDVTFVAAGDLDAALEGAQTQIDAIAA